MRHTLPVTTHACTLADSEMPVPLIALQGRIPVCRLVAAVHSGSAVLGGAAAALRRQGQTGFVHGR